MQATSLSPLLQVHGLQVELNTASGSVRALQNISFNLERGQTLGIIGESGCGKSLTALAMMGLLPEGARVQGSIRLDGVELLGQSDQALSRLRGNQMAMVFQEPMTALNPLHTVGQQIAEPLRLHRGLDAQSAKRRVVELLEKVEIPRAAERLGAYPHELSGGQRQRVMIAMALACQPRLLIADEPTTALDASTQQEVLALMTALVRESEMSLLLISHDLGLMHDHVDRVAVMYAGSIVEEAATRDLFAVRHHPYTQGLFAARPRLGLARGTRLPTIAGNVPDLRHLPVGCSFQPRCTQAIASCTQSKPALLPLVSGTSTGERALSCFLGEQNER
jgi:peptide/nickel transport system ATP-binding protein